MFKTVVFFYHLSGMVATVSFRKRINYLVLFIFKAIHILED